MSVNVTVMSELVYVSTILKNQRLLINNMEPGMRAANNTLQAILCPPFKYRWNRKTKNVAISQAGGTDYPVAWSDLGWIETQWLQTGDGEFVQLEGDQSIARVSMVKRPAKVAAVYDDNEGNVTMRFDATPDADYTAYFDYQAKATLLTSPASTFAPIPDEYTYLVTKWMLAEGAIVTEDPRQPQFLRDAVTSLLAMQDGMTIQEKAIMAQQMLNMGNTGMRAQMGAQQGTQARGQQ